MKKNFDNCLDSLSCCSEYYQEDNYNSKEKYRIFNSIVKDLKLKIISKPEETLSKKKKPENNHYFIEIM